MVNVDVSDGLLYISEKEAIEFSRAMFAEYQKKVTPEDHLKARAPEPGCGKFQRDAAAELKQSLLMVLKQIEMV
jgi:hypothetical protein